MTDREVLKERLEQALSASGLSKTELAAATELSPSQISRYFSGERTPTIENLRTMALAMECSIDWLVNLSGFADMGLRPKQDKPSMSWLKGRMSAEDYKAVKRFIELAEDAYEKPY